MAHWFEKLTPPFFFIQSEVKPKPILPRLYTFCRAWGQIYLFISSFDWFIALSVCFVIGKMNTLVLVHDTQLKAALYLIHNKRLLTLSKRYETLEVVEE